MRFSVQSLFPYRVSPARGLLRAMRLLTKSGVKHMTFQDDEQLREMKHSMRPVEERVLVSFGSSIC